MHGPSVNVKFYIKLVKTCEQAQVPNLIDIGTCSLHVIHGAFKSGIESTNCEMKKRFKRKLSNAPCLNCSHSRLFKCYRVRYISLVFCATRQVEDKKGADRLLKLWENVTKIINCQKVLARVKATKLQKLRTCKGSNE